MNKTSAINAMTFQHDCPQNSIGQGRKPVFINRYLQVVYFVDKNILPAS